MISANAVVNRRDWDRNDAPDPPRPCRTISEKLVRLEKLNKALSASSALVPTFEKTLLRL